MERVQILLDSEQKRVLNKIAKREQQSFSELVRKMLDAQIEQHRKAQLASAARALLADYETDEELTAFTAIDGEDFHA